MFQLEDTVCLFGTLLLLDPIHFPKSQPCLIIGSVCQIGALLGTSLLSTNLHLLYRPEHPCLLSGSIHETSGEPYLIFRTPLLMGTQEYIFYVILGNHEICQLCLFFLPWKNARKLIFFLSLSFFESLFMYWCRSVKGTEVVASLNAILHQTKDSIIKLSRTKLTFIKGAKYVLPLQCFAVGQKLIAFKSVKWLCTLEVLAFPPISD